MGSGEDDMMMMMMMIFLSPLQAARGPIGELSA